jgi:F-type H+-transporting ATPase subunit b
LRVRIRCLLTSLLLASVLGLVAAPVVRAQTDSQPANTASSHEAKGQESHGEDEHAQFLHTPIVKSIAGALHLSTETTASLFQIINSAILIGLILFFVFKALPKAIRNRTAAIQKKLVEARSATEIANERLAAVEAKLARIGEDIEAIRQQTERDSLEDEKRIKQALEDERARIVKSAEQEIASAGAAAQRELKRFAAGLAIDQAAKKIELTTDSDKALVEHFGKVLAGRFGKGGQN